MANKNQKSIVKISPHPETVTFLKEKMLKFGGVKITGFGMFTLKRTKGIMNGMHPYSGKRQNFPPYTKISFKPVKSFKDEMQRWKK